MSYSDTEKLTMAKESFAVAYITSMLMAPFTIFKCRSCLQ